MWEMGGSEQWGGLHEIELCLCVYQSALNLVQCLANAGAQ